MTRRSVPAAVFVGLAVAIAIVGGLLAYTSTLQQSAQQPTQVTWLDANGNPLTSLSLNPNIQGRASQTVSFRCSPSIGKTTLRASSGLGNALVLSQTDFSSCGSSPNVVTLMVSSTNYQSASGTLQAFQPDSYKLLSGPLTISIQV